MYLESMAENRAFIRAVRNALNINILGLEEARSKQEDSDDLLPDTEATLSPQGTIKAIIEGNGKTFGDLKHSMDKHGYKTEGLSDYEDIPPEICLEVIGKIQKKTRD
jgi:hypothetical protein